MMTEGPRPLPPARERYRSGIRPFAENLPLDVMEALPDKVFIKLRGNVTAREDAALNQFVELIGSSVTGYPEEHTRLIGAGNWIGRKWTADVLKTTTISGGKFELLRNGASARIDIVLWLNPTRTLEHLLAQHNVGDLAELTPQQFFRKAPEVPATATTLDRSDNMVSNFVALGGTVHSELLQRINVYLAAFEDALKMRILDELCPVEQGYQAHQRGGLLTAQNDDCRVEINWGDLSVFQFEACWERQQAEALRAVHQLADEVLSAARRGEVNSHLGHRDVSVARDLGALSVRLPLVDGDGISLVAYAKSHDRIRIEVRYFQTPRQVKRRLPPKPRRLTDWFNAFREDALPRVPWAELHRLMAPSSTPHRDALVTLLDAVSEAAGSSRSLRRGLLQQLLTAGAVTATGRGGDAPTRTMEKLARLGVVEHIRLVRRDAEEGKRYRLTPAYAGLVPWLTR